MDSLKIYHLFLIFLLNSVAYSQHIDYPENNWGGVCSTGTRQSPISFPNEKDFFYKDFNVNLNFKKTDI